MQHQIIKIDESKNNKSIFIISLFLKNINLIGKRMHQNLTKSIIDFIIFLTRIPNQQKTNFPIYIRNRNLSINFSDHH